MPSAERTKLTYDKILVIPIRTRLRDIELWLKASFPTTYPVEVRVERIAAHDGRPVDGECYIGAPRKLRIRVSRDLERHTAIETLLHEYAHAVTWPTPHAESHLRSQRVHADHSDAFWLAFGQIYRAFFDGAGWKASSGFR